ncbi:DUF6982 domain-containing protein [Terriglobus albidus]|uniref:DUF6982 domain-containing protein n=1 Tax=Terriglobus albidus TaxID=1592106 RepID=UPI003D7C2855
MESQSSSKQDENQLQGSSLQDQGVRADREEDIRPGQNLAGLERAVLRYTKHLIKGYIDRSHLEEIASRQEPPVLEGSISLVDEADRASRDHPLSEAKAIFFVRDFEGDRERRDILFHDGAELLQNLWVRVTFPDGEALEGFVQNDAAYLHAQGFFLTPTDPTSNNVLVYIIKSQIKEFQVLGLRP